MNTMCMVYLVGLKFRFFLVKTFFVRFNSVLGMQKEFSHARFPFVNFSFIMFSERKKNETLNQQNIPAIRYMYMYELKRTLLNIITCTLTSRHSFHMYQSIATLYIMILLKELSAMNSFAICKLERRTHNAMCLYFSPLPSPSLLLPLSPPTLLFYLSSPFPLSQVR